MTTLAESVETLPRVRRRPRRVAVLVALAVVIVANGVVIGSQAVRLRTQVGRERRALAASRAVEAIAARSIAGTRDATTSALGTRTKTLAFDAEQQKQRAQAYGQLIRIERGLGSTNQTLSNTQAAQVQIAQYSAQRDACITGVRHATTALQRGDPSGAVAALNASTGACSAALAADTGARFPYDFPDPSVLTVGSRYYAYSTNSGVGNIQVLVSSDLVHWSIVGDGLAGLPAWASPGATWAPSVTALGGGYVAYYTARDIASGLQCVSVAVSFSPAGPFVDLSTAPLVCQPSGSIDPSTFVDATGTTWLLWKSEADATGPDTIWSQPLGAAGLTFRAATTPTPLLTPGQRWEHGVVEGPSMIQIAGVDYLFYSGGSWTTADYAEGVAVCDGPAGPCHRALPGPVLASAGRLAGPGGGTAFTTPTGAVWLAFHAFTQPDIGYPNSRTLHFATVRIVGDVPIVTPQ
jgi:Glycosyl hydrolases family 43